MKTRKPKKPRKLSKEELRSLLSARRRFHEAANRRNDTVEKLQRRQKIEKLVGWAGAVVFTPIMLTLFVYMSCHYGLHDPLPWQLSFLMFCIIFISIPSCFSLLFAFLVPKPCFGRWIIVNAGIFYRYGKSPHRFVPFSSLRNFRVEKPKSLSAVISFDTDYEPLRISEWVSGSGKLPRFDLLPFLNLLIDHLRRNGWVETDLTPLLKFQHVLHGHLVEKHCLRYLEWLMILCGFASPLWVLPFYHYISNFPYPAVLWVVVFCALVSCLIFLVLNSRLERWKEGKIDRILQEISLDEPQ